MNVCVGLGDEEGTRSAGEQGNKYSAAWTIFRHGRAICSAGCVMGKVNAPAWHRLSGIMALLPRPVPKSLKKMLETLWHSETKPNWEQQEEERGHHVANSCSVASAAHRRPIDQIRERTTSTRLNRTVARSEHVALAYLVMMIPLQPGGALDRGEVLAHNAFIYYYTACMRVRPLLVVQYNKFWFVDCRQM